MSSVEFKLYRRFLQSALFWLVVGVLSGMLLAWQRVFPNVPGGLAFWSPGRLLHAHSGVLLFGWCPLALVALWLGRLTREQKLPLRWPRWWGLSCWLWNGTIFLGTVLVLAGWGAPVSLWTWPRWLYLLLGLIWFPCLLSSLLSLRQIPHSWPPGRLLWTGWGWWLLLLLLATFLPHQPGALSAFLGHALTGLGLVLPALALGSLFLPASWLQSISFSRVYWGMVYLFPPLAVALLTPAKFLWIAALAGLFWSLAASLLALQGLKATQPATPPSPHKEETEQEPHKEETENKNEARETRGGPPLQLAKEQSSEEARSESALQEKRAGRPYFRMGWLCLALVGLDGLARVVSEMWLGLAGPSWREAHIHLALLGLVTSFLLGALAQDRLRLSSLSAPSATLPQWLFRLFATGLSLSVAGAWIEGMIQLLFLRAGMAPGEALPLLPRLLWPLGTLLLGGAFLLLLTHWAFLWKKKTEPRATGAKR